MSVHVHISSLEQCQPVSQHHVEYTERKLMVETLAYQSQAEAAPLQCIETMST